MELAPSTSGTAVTRTIAGLSQFSHIKMLVKIGDCYLNWLDFYSQYNQQLIVEAGNSNSTYHIKITVTCNFSTSQISIKSDDVKGWTPSQCCVDKVIAIEIA